MWELDCEKSWAPKNWCFWTVVLEKTLESPLDCKDIQLVHPKGDQSWDFFGRNDAKAETVLWPPHGKSWLTGKDWCWEGLGAGGEGNDRGWDGWMTSPTRWTWVWVNSGSWWWTGRPGMLQFMGSQRVGHDWATDLIRSDLMEPGRLQSMGSLGVGHDWVTSLSLFTFMHWRRNGNPLQCSCLENPRDGGAWLAAVYGVAQSQKQLKWLSIAYPPPDRGQEKERWDQNNLKFYHHNGYTKSLSFL